jgi:hypothetical protein
MDPVFLEHRCPNQPTDSDQECRSELGGPSLESLSSFSFDVPFVDIRYCKRCRILWKITISDGNLRPKYEPIKKGEKVNFKLPDLGIVAGKRSGDG